MLLFSPYLEMKLKYLKETDGIWFLCATDVNWDPVYIGFGLGFGFGFGFFFQHLGLNVKVVNCH